MHQLNELDASFLFLESETTPMHVGGLYIFDAAEREQALTFDDFRDYLNHRLHLAGFFRQKLMHLPFNLDRPYWIDDPDFDINRHLESVDLQGGDHAALIALAEDRLATLLPRTRPLWEVTWVEGFGPDTLLPADGFALVVRVHHAAVDAFSGEEVMGKLLEYTPDTPTKTRPPAWHPEPAPRPEQLLPRASLNLLRKPFQFMSLTQSTMTAAMRDLMEPPIGRLRTPGKVLGAPRTPFNRNLTERRCLHSTSIDLARLKTLKAAIGPDISLNDLVLGICAEALQRYMADHGIEPEDSLVALTPVSVRSRSLRQPMGNQMSAMLVALATDEPDPARRVARIRANTRTSENYQEAIAADRLTERLPSTLVALSTRLYSEFHLAQHYQPVFNLPITNVPGPQVPLYLKGARLVQQVNSAPLFHGAGLAILALSYAGAMHLNLTTCPDLVPDGDQLTALMETAVEAIEASAMAGTDNLSSA